MFTLCTFRYVLLPLLTEGFKGRPGDFPQFPHSNTKAYSKIHVWSIQCFLDFFGLPYIKPTCPGGSHHLPSTYLLQLQRLIGKRSHLVVPLARPHYDAKQRTLAELKLNFSSVALYTWHDAWWYDVPQIHKIWDTHKHLKFTKRTQIMVDDYSFTKGFLINFLK